MSNLGTTEGCLEEADRQQRLSREAFNRGDFKKSALHADEAIQLRRYAAKLDRLAAKLERDEARSPT